MSARVRIETLRLETRAVAFDRNDAAIALFVSRASDGRLHPDLGSVREARVTALARDQGGAFVKLDSGPDAFLRLNETEKLVEGARLMVRIAAEARNGKRARVERTDASTEGDALGRWLARLPFPFSREDAKPGDTEISFAFEEALGASVALPGGGTLHIERARALTAADVDSAGRVDKSGPAARAQALNLSAARTLARQASLRRLGGLIVLDCVAPISKTGGEAIREAFITAFSAITRRQSHVIAPSAFGLMEASLAWAEAPVMDRWRGDDHQPTDEAIVYDALRELERRASEATMARLTLALPDAAHRWMKTHIPEADAKLGEKYGARLMLTSHDAAAAAVKEP